MSLSIANYKNNDCVRRYVNNLPWRESCKAKSSLYRYNQLLLSIVASFFQRNNNELMGYYPKYNKIHEKIKKNPKDDKRIDRKMDDLCSRMFVQAINKAKECGCIVIVVSSPSLEPNDDNSSLSRLCKNNDILYLDFYDLDIFNNHPEFFNDEVHMNDDGAHAFTALLFEKIKNSLLLLKSAYDY